MKECVCKEMELDDGKLIFFSDTFNIIRLSKDDTDISKIIEKFLKYRRRYNLKEKVSKQAVNLELDMDISNLCNLNCVYCYAKQNSSPEKLMKKEISEKVFSFFSDKFKECKKVKIDFIGRGEPLLNGETLFYSLDLAKKYFKVKRINFFLITNGTLLSNEIYNLLMENKVSIGISIDGDKERHNKNRPFKDGQGSYNCVVRNVSNATKKPGNLWALSVINENVHDIYEILNSHLELGFKRIQLKLVRNTKNNTNDENKALYNKVSTIYDKYIDKLLKDLLNGKYESVKATLNNNDTVGRILLSLLTYNKAIRRCKAGFARFSINPKGDIYPCSSFSSINGFKMGNVLDKDSFNNQISNSFWESNVDNIYACKECWCKYLCGGPCKYSSFVKHNNIETVDENYCILIKSLCEKIIKMIYELSKNNKNIIKDLQRIAKIESTLRES